MAEWLGSGLQNHLQRFESARDLNPDSVRGFYFLSMNKILLIDNYDSFTFNLYHYLEELNPEGIEVMRNDCIDFEKAAAFDKVVVSPGPGLPDQAGDLMKFLHQFVHQKNILGICLGQQAIAQHFGMQLIRLEKVVHGQASEIKVIDGSELLFHEMPSSFKAGRYHSWAIDPKSISDDFKITSISNDNSIMSISHKKLPLKAVQFHPESILSEFGKTILANWLRFS